MSIRTRFMDMAQICERQLACELSIVEYWNHLYGEADGMEIVISGHPQGYLHVFSGRRPPGGVKGKVNKRRFEKVSDRFFLWPEEKDEAARYALEEAGRGWNVYSCGHLLTAPRRVKGNATDVLCLWADGDEAGIPEGIPIPTIVIETSPGRYQYYWRLGHKIAPGKAEELNHRLAYAIGADRSGWDLTQLLRPPGTLNYDYAGVYGEVPTVRVVN